MVKILRFPSIIFSLLLICLSRVSVADPTKVIPFKVDKHFKAGNPYQYVAEVSKRISMNDVMAVELNHARLKTIDVDLENSQDVQYYGILYLGSDKQKLTFIFDTGSEWLWAPTDACSNCREETTKYKPSASFKPTGTQHSIIYLSGSVRGDVGVDVVRVTEGGDPINMNLLAVTYEKSTEGTLADGIVGLTPTATDGASLLLDILYQQNLIDNKTFGFDINRENETSKIILGGYDQERVTNFTDFAWVDLDQTVDWRVRHKKITVGNKTVSTKGGFSVFDSGTSLTTFDLYLFDDILGKLMDNKT